MSWQNWPETVKENLCINRKDIDAASVLSEDSSSDCEEVE